MAIKVTKPQINLREKLSSLDTPSGVAGNAMLRAETPQEQFNLIGAGRKNLIINGAMQVAQRGISATAIASNKYTTCDRFLSEFPVSAWSVNSTQETDGPSGFSYSHKMAATSGASLGSSEYMIPFEYRVEGHDASRLGWGTLEAKDVTLSFWIKSNRTGINTVDFTKQGGGDGVFIARQYTISSSDTWEKKTITIPANTNATNVRIDNTNAFSIFWWALSGSDFNSGEIVEQWGTQTPVNRAPGTSSTIASGDYWQITGVQLELGKVATPFEHRSYGEELALCQRYYQKSRSSNPIQNAYGGHQIAVIAGQEPQAVIRLVPEMRVAPSVVLYSAYGSGVSSQWYGAAFQQGFSTHARAFARDTIAFVIDNTDVVAPATGWCEIGWTAEAEL